MTAFQSNFNPKSLKIQGQNPFGGNSSKVSSSQDKEAEALKTNSAWSVASSGKQSADEKSFVKTGSMCDLYGAEFSTKSESSDNKNEFSLGKTDFGMTDYEKEIASGKYIPNLSGVKESANLNRGNYTDKRDECEQKTASKLDEAINSANASEGRQAAVKNIEEGQLADAQKQQKAANAMQVDQNNATATPASLEEVNFNDANVSASASDVQATAETRQGGEVAQIAEQNEQDGKQNPDNIGELANQEAEGVAQYNNGNAQSAQLTKQSSVYEMLSQAAEKSAAAYGAEKANSNAKATEAGEQAQVAQGDATTAAQSIAQQIAIFGASKAAEKGFNALDKAGQVQEKGGETTKAAGVVAEQVAKAQELTADGIIRVGQSLLSNPYTASAGQAMISTGTAMKTAAKAAQATAKGTQAAGDAEKATGQGTQATAKAGKTKEKATQTAAKAEQGVQEGIKTAAEETKELQEGIQATETSKAAEFGAQQSSEAARSSALGQQSAQLELGASAAKDAAKTGASLADQAVAAAKSGGDLVSKAASSALDWASNNKLAAAGLGSSVLGAVTGNQALSVGGSVLGMGGALANGNFAQAAMQAPGLLNSLKSQNSTSGATGNVAYSGSNASKRIVSFSDVSSQLSQASSNFNKYVFRSTSSSLT